MRKLNILICITVGLSAAAVEAALLPVDLPGTTRTAGWGDLTAVNYPGYPTFMTSSAAWPAPIPQTSGTGNMTLNKVGGLGFPSNGGGIYIGTMTTGTGTFVLGTPSGTALTSLETIVFQMDVDGIGADWNSVISAVNLDYNGGNQSIAPLLSLLQGQQSAGMIFGQPANRFQLLFQWDVTGLGVTDFGVGWTAGTHALAYEYKIVQGDEFAAVPEPAALPLLAAAFGVCFGWRKWRRMA